MESSEEEHTGTASEPRRKLHTKPPRPDAKLLVFDIEIDWPACRTGRCPTPTSRTGRVSFPIAWTFMNGRGQERRDSLVHRQTRRVRDSQAGGVGRGLTPTKKALKEGTPLDYVLADFAQCLEWADLVLAHNLEFKETVVRCEAYRLGRGDAL